MANVFAILSAIALAAACFLAVKNRGAYEHEIEERKTQETRLTRVTGEYTDRVAQYDATYAERVATEKENQGLTSNQTDETRKNNGLESEKTAKTSETEANAKKIADIEEQLKEIGTIPELIDNIKKLKESLEGLTLDIASSEAKQTDLTAEKGRTEGVIANYGQKNQNFATKHSFFASTRVSAIYPAYGFVTLPIGNTSGVISGSTLEVQRDGATIARLRVTSVEAGRAAAEIIPDSVAADTTLMVGDRVVPGAAVPAGPAKPAGPSAR
jgi:hypothetical protein